MNRRAVILAGGRGTRLRPYTVVLPKPLMPIGEYPIMEVVIRQLAYHEFDHITIAVNHQAELIKAFFGDGSKWHLRIDYSLEDEPLGTMGPLKLIRDLPDQFLVMNGDVLTDLNFADFHAEHAQENRLFTVSSYQREQKVDYGVLMTDPQGTLRGFQEKPVTGYEVSMGIYMVSRDVLPVRPSAGAIRIRRADAGSARGPADGARTEVQRLLARHRPGRRLLAGDRGILEHETALPE